MAVEKEKLKGLLTLLEERLVQHDNSRKEVQSKVREECAKILEDVDSLEESIRGEIRKDFDQIESKFLDVISQLNTAIAAGGRDADELDFLYRQAQQLMSSKQRYKIEYNESAGSFADACKPQIAASSMPLDFLRAMNLVPNKTQFTVDRLQAHLDSIRESMNAAQSELEQICTQRRDEARKVDERINEELRTHFSREDASIQSLVRLVADRLESADPDELKALASKAKRALLTAHIYSLNRSSLCEYDLVVSNDVHLKFLDVEERKPTDFTASLTEKGTISISFSFLSEDEVNILKPFNLKLQVKLYMFINNNDNNSNVDNNNNNNNNNNNKILTKEYTLGKENVQFADVFPSDTTYCLKMRVEYREMCTQWSDVIELAIPNFNACCVWKERPGDADSSFKSTILPGLRIASPSDFALRCETVIGNISLPPKKVTSWNIKDLNSVIYGDIQAYAGVAPCDIDQNSDDNFNKCGWYFNYYYLTLHSGPPHNYRCKKYGLRKKNGEYVHISNSVGVVMDTIKGDLSFFLDGVNYGVAYERIPLDKPLVPCVLLCGIRNFVELDLSEVKWNEVDRSIPAPSHIKAKSYGWDSVTLTWKAVKGASFYQVKMDGSRVRDTTAVTTLVKRGLLAETMHSFRVRAVKGTAVSDWSDVVQGKTLKMSFEASGWEECSSETNKYAVDEGNHRIVTNINTCSCCVVIGNTPVPPNAVTSWSIKILKFGRSDDGYGNFVGVAPSPYINRSNANPNKLGWFLDCYDSTLSSGPPHNYEKRKYGPRKIKGEYVHTKDSVGVVMNITKGELSFVLNRTNRGVAFEGIPLDKPLVPCVILGYKGDSVELVI